jgi:hypothetical protein
VRNGATSVAIAAARFYTPLIVFLALMLLATRAPGTGAGFVAGLVFMLGLIAHALVFGAAQAGAAMSPVLMRALLAFGLAASMTGILSPRFPFAREVIEASLFLVTSAGGALVIAVLFGRAPTMRDHAS